MRAWVSFDVRPWIRPKKVRVSLMVNSLYNARSCETQDNILKASTWSYIMHLTLPCKDTHVDRNVATKELK